MYADRISLLLRLSPFHSRLLPRSIRRLSIFESKEPRMTRAPVLEECFTDRGRRGPTKVPLLEALRPGC